MTAVQLKSRLIVLIQKEGDARLLELVRSLLDRASKEDAYRSMLIAGAIRSERDFAEGRTLTHEEAKARVKASFRKKKE